MNISHDAAYRKNNPYRIVSVSVNGRVHGRYPSLEAAKKEAAQMSAYGIKVVSVEGCDVLVTEPVYC